MKSQTHRVIERIIASEGEREFFIRIDFRVSERFAAGCKEETKQNKNCVIRIFNSLDDNASTFFRLI